jgi:hypothetical protein
MAPLTHPPRFPLPPNFSWNVAATKRDWESQRNLVDTCAVLRCKAGQTAGSARGSLRTSKGVASLPQEVLKSLDTVLHKSAIDAEDIPCYGKGVITQLQERGKQFLLSGDPDPLCTASSTSSHSFLRLRLDPGNPRTGPGNSKTSLGVTGSKTRGLKTASPVLLILWVLSPNFAHAISQDVQMRPPPVPFWSHQWSSASSRDFIRHLCQVLDCPELAPNFVVNL